MSPAPAKVLRPWNPWNDKVCLEWFATLRRRFGLIPQIGLPDMQDQADIPMDALYVPLRLGSAGPSHGDDGEVPLAALARLRRMVVLGGPGSGKSTLVSWLCCAWSQRPGRDDPDGERVRIALPVVLRDLSLDTSVSTWEALLERVGRQAWWSLAREPRLGEWCREGRAVLLVDGLDEIANLEVRRAVNAAVRDAAKRFPEMAVVVTSRVLGYEEAPLEEVSGGTHPHAESLQEGTSLPTLPDRRGTFSTTFVKPFGQAEIADFARRWYTLRVRDVNHARERAEHLLASIARHPSLTALAGTPSLLALMAVVHRVYAELPAGRAILFEKITEAYLESVDRAYGQNEMPQPAGMKRRWLARLATEIQERRSAGEAGKSGSGDSVVLLDRAEAVRLLAGELGGEADAERFLDWVMRRSGLLIPQTESQLAFSHLSVQEYLAAVAVVDDLGAGFLDPGVGRAAEKRMFRWAGQASGIETTILAFELLGTRGGRGARLVFDRLLRNAPKRPAAARDHLAALFVALREDSVVALGPLPECQPILDEVVIRMARGEGVVPSWCDTLSALAGDTRVTRLTFKWPHPELDWSGLPELPKLVDLSLWSEQNFCPLNVVARCQSLQQLTIVVSTEERDLSQLAGLTALWNLSIFGASGRDLRLLAPLHGLRELWLDGGDNLPDLLANLRDLQVLSIQVVGVEDLLAVWAAPGLKTLLLWEQNLLDLSSIADHPSLQTVQVWYGSDFTAVKPANARWRLVVRDVEQ